MHETKRYLLIACEIVYREMCALISRCNHVVDVRFMRKALHDLGEKKMMAELQAAIDAVDVNAYDAVLLGYGLCNNGLVGLHSRIPMVVPRAHDCITLLMGSMNRYQAYFNEHPGTFFKSTGWMERGSGMDAPEDGIMSQLKLNNTYREYLEKYGEDNALYIMETLGGWVNNYSNMAYIDMKLGDFTHYRSAAEQEAADNGWTFDALDGDLSLMERLLAGSWDAENFLYVRPGERIKASLNNGIIAAEAYDADDK